MPKRKSRRARKRRDKLHIPHTVEDAEKSLELPIVAGWDNAPLIKTQSLQFDKDQIKELARAIYEYMAEKDLTRPGGSWQDFILISTLRRVYQQSATEKLVAATGENSGMAEIRAIYENLPPEIAASDVEIEQIIRKLKEQKPAYEDIAYEDIVAKIAELRGVNIDVKTLKQRSILAEVEAIVDAVVKKHEQNKWIIFIEGIVIGLISNGLFELLKGALSSLVMRAPYAEAQIYEIECDVFRAFDTWKQSVKDTNGFEEREIEIALFYVLHAICVLSVLGRSVPENPLFDDVNFTEQELNE